MRSLLLLSLAALPLAASAQARNVAALAPETTMNAAMHGAAAPAPTHLPTGLHESITTTYKPDFADHVDTADSTLETVFGTPSNVSAPTLTKWSPVTISPQDAAAINKSATVSVGMTINRAGEPMTLHIARSASPTLDQIALATVKNYRFKPATVNYIPVVSAVTVTVELKK